MEGGWWYLDSPPLIRGGEFCAICWHAIHTLCLWRSNSPPLKGRGRGGVCNFPLRQAMRRHSPRLLRRQSPRPGLRPPRPLKGWGVLGNYFARPSHTLPPRYLLPSLQGRGWGWVWQCGGIHPAPRGRSPSRMDTHCHRYGGCGNRRLRHTLDERIVAGLGHGVWRQTGDEKNGIKLTN